MTLFDILSDILGKKNGKLYENEGFEQVFSSYMICRYLSMRQSLLNYAVILNKYQTILPKKEFYLLCYKLIPKQQNTFIKYIKSSKKTKK